MGAGVWVQVCGCRCRSLTFSLLLDALGGDVSVRQRLALRGLFPLGQLEGPADVDAAQLLREVALPGLRHGVFPGLGQVLGDGVDEVVGLRRLELSAFLGQSALVGKGGSRV